VCLCASVYFQRVLRSAHRQKGKEGGKTCLCPMGLSPFESGAEISFGPIRPATHTRRRRTTECKADLRQARLRSACWADHLSSPGQRGKVGKRRGRWSWMLLQWDSSRDGSHQMSLTPDKTGARQWRGSGRSCDGRSRHQKPRAIDGRSAALSLLWPSTKSRLKGSKVAYGETRRALAFVHRQQHP
jgi:hypothetical protein